MNRRNLSVDLYYKNYGYSTCVTWAGSLMKRLKRGGFSASQTQSYLKLSEMDRSSLKMFSLFRQGSFSSSWTQSYSKLSEMDRSSLKKCFPVGGAFLPSDHWWNVQWCVEYGLVKLHHITRYEPSISPKGRKGGGGGLFGRFEPTWGLGVPSI